MLAFTAARLLTPTDAVEHPLLLVEQGRFLEVAAKSSLQTPAGISLSDFGDGVIVPGYVDLHVHGGADSTSWMTMARRCQRSNDCSRGMGSRVFFPTTVTAPIDATLRALERLADAIEESQSADNVLIR